MTPTVDVGAKYAYYRIDPRLKLLLVAVRRALLILADALKDYYES